jgi:hypothetical protein
MESTRLLAAWLDWILDRVAIQEQTKRQHRSTRHRYTHGIYCITIPSPRAFYATQLVLCHVIVTLLPEYSYMHEAGTSPGNKIDAMRGIDAEGSVL